MWAPAMMGSPGRDKWTQLAEFDFQWNPADSEISMEGFSQRLRRNQPQHRKRPCDCYGSKSSRSVRSLQFMNCDCVVARRYQRCIRAIPCSWIMAERQVVIGRCLSIDKVDSHGMVRWCWRLGSGWRERGIGKQNSKVWRVLIGDGKRIRRYGSGIHHGDSIPAGGARRLVCIAKPLLHSAVDCAFV